MDRTQIYLTKAETQGVARVAARTGRKRSEVIREAIDQFLKRQGQQDRLTRLQTARGMWEGRELPSLEEMRRDFDRF